MSVDADEIVEAITRLLQNERFPPFLDVKQASEFSGMSINWLNVARIRGDGPPFIKAGDRSIRYDRDSLAHWMREREVQP